jgi:hypothetical protein
MGVHVNMRPAAAAVVLTIIKPASARHTPAARVDIGQV